MQVKSIIFTLLLYISSFFFSNASEKNFINELREGGKLILIRHSIAPGTGDPLNFDIMTAKLNVIYQLKVLNRQKK